MWVFRGKSIRIDYPEPVAEVFQKSPQTWDGAVIPGRVIVQDFVDMLEAVGLSDTAVDAIAQDLVSVHSYYIMGHNKLLKYQHITSGCIN